MRHYGQEFSTVVKAVGETGEQSNSHPLVHGPGPVETSIRTMASPKKTHTTVGAERADTSDPLLSQSNLQLKQSKKTAALGAESNEALAGDTGAVSVETTIATGQSNLDSSHVVAEAQERVSIIEAHEYLQETLASIKGAWQQNLTGPRLSDYSRLTGALKRARLSQVEDSELYESAQAMLDQMDRLVRVSDSDDLHFSKYPVLRSTEEWVKGIEPMVRRSETARHFLEYQRTPIHRSLLKQDAEVSVLFISTSQQAFRSEYTVSTYLFDAMQKYVPAPHPFASLRLWLFLSC